jgi:fumarate reductase flavoprotein subunit
VIVHAKAVLLSTGGFSDNKEMVKKYVKDDVQWTVLATSKRTGDGIRMAMEAGGLLGSMDTIGEQIKWDFTFPVRNTFVNQLGTRFVNEELAVMAYPVLTQWINHAYAIIDQNDVEDVMTGKGVSQMRMYTKSGSNAKFFYPQAGPGHFDVDQTETLTGYGYPDNHDRSLQARLDKAVADGRVFKGNTIAELAKKIDVPADALEETFRKVNLSYDVKHDIEMGKNPIYLRSLKKGPFYATKYSHRTAWGTLGGVRIDEFGQAINQDYKTIPGLYMGGTDIGGLYDGIYPYDNEGTTSCVSYNMARVTVKHIKETLLDKK